MQKRHELSAEILDGCQGGWGGGMGADPAYDYQPSDGEVACDVLGTVTGFAWERGLTALGPVGALVGALSADAVKEFAADICKNPSPEPNGSLSDTPMALGDTPIDETNAAELVALAGDGSLGGDGMEATASFEIGGFEGGGFEGGRFEGEEFTSAAF